MKSRYPVINHLRSEWSELLHTVGRYRTAQQFFYEIVFVFQDAHKNEILINRFSSAVCAQQVAPKRGTNRKRHGRVYAKRFWSSVWPENSPVNDRKSLPNLSTLLTFWINFWGTVDWPTPFRHHPGYIWWHPRTEHTQTGNAVQIAVPQHPQEQQTQEQHTQPHPHFTPTPTHIPQTRTHGRVWFWQHSHIQHAA